MLSFCLWLPRQSFQIWCPGALTSVFDGAQVPGYCKHDPRDAYKAKQMPELHPK